MIYIVAFNKYLFNEREDKLIWAMWKDKCVSENGWAHTWPLRQWTPWKNGSRSNASAPQASTSRRTVVVEPSLVLVTVLGGGGV